jgi:hypothetical protein
MSEPKKLDRPVEAWTFLPGNGLSTPIPTADGGMHWGERFGGLTKREHAATLLRVPESGDPDLDAMIRTAQRRDLAAMAMQAILTNPKVLVQVGWECKALARNCFDIADAFLSHPVAEKEG